jgi:hypothetical protein
VCLFLSAGLLALLVAASAPSYSTGVYRVAALRDNVQALADPGQRRLLLHIVFGSAVVLLPLALAWVTRAAGPRRPLAGALALLLVVAAASQVWLGVLLLCDAREGVLTHFSPRAEARPTQPTGGGRQRPWSR